MQSKKESLKESLCTVSIGFVISLAMAYWFLPLYGVTRAFHVSLEITIVYTVTSVLRLYLVRRFYNKKLKK